MVKKAETAFQRKWDRYLDDRQKKEIAFAELYTTEFNHGTDGHNRLNLINALVKLLDNYQIDTEGA